MSAMEISPALPYFQHCKICLPSVPATALQTIRVTLSAEALGWKLNAAHEIASDMMPGTVNIMSVWPDF